MLLPPTNKHAAAFAVGRIQGSEKGIVQDLMRPRVSPLLFVASLACFLLPFATISCGSQRIATASGFQLVTGASVTEPQAREGVAKKQFIEAEPAAIVALAFVVFGLALSLMHVRPLLPAACAVISVISLFVLRARLEDQVAARGAGALQLDFEIGFPLTLVTLTAAVAWNAYLYISGHSTKASKPPLPAIEERLPAPVAALPPPTMPSKTVERRLIKCPLCGKATIDDAFCMACGKSLASAS